MKFKEALLTTSKGFKVHIWLYQRTCQRVFNQYWNSFWELVPFSEDWRKFWVISYSSLEKESCLFNISNKMYIYMFVYCNGEDSNYVCCLHQKIFGPPFKGPFIGCKLHDYFFQYYLLVSFSLQLMACSQ